MSNSETKHDAYISLGSNLGDRVQTLKQALAAIAALPGTNLVAVSSFYETEAVGGVADRDFINAACHISTGLSPQELMSALLRIEESLGRRRAEKWGNRTCDLDILVYDDLVSDDPFCRLPHPGLAERKFMITPLAEIAPGLIIPQIGKKAQDIERYLPNSYSIKRFFEKDT